MPSRKQYRVVLGTRCPDCDGPIMSAWQADFHPDERLVRYLWTCEACVSDFETRQQLEAA